ncbi:MAG: DUF547 domain-containing protein [Microcoleaceae cyanobacterium]
MIKIISFLSLLVLAVSCSNSTEFNFENTNSEQPQSSVALAESTNFSYDNYAQVLTQYVNDKGEVDYQSLKQNRQPLDSFHNSIATLSPQVYQNWTEDEQIAFWVNIYNSLTLEAIINNYPTDSIKDIPGVWKRLNFEVMGEELTLDQIEHEILRKQFDEPRIHMGLVCASIGCPLLRQEPFTANQLDQQLNEQTVEFLALDRNFEIDKEENKVYLSSIFKWFGEDFESKHAAENQYTGKEKERAVLNFVNQYLDAQNQTYLTQGEYQISYLNYDWSLNDVKSN